MGKYIITKLSQYITEAIHPSDVKLFYVLKDDKVIAINLKNTEEVNKYCYNSDGRAIEGVWGVEQFDGNESIMFDSFEDAQNYRDKKVADYLKKKTQNRKYPDLSRIAYDIATSKEVDADDINRGSCFKFAYEINKLGYNDFSFVYSEEESDYIHVYVKLSNTLFFDADGFHSKKEVKYQYDLGEDNYLVDNDASELKYYQNTDIGLSTRELSEAEWAKILKIIHNPQ